jgi:hypothetical protein
VRRGGALPERARPRARGVLACVSAGARTGEGPASTSTAAAALDAGLTEDAAPRRHGRAVLRCVCPMPLPVPLPFPRLFLSRPPAGWPRPGLVLSSGPGGVGASGGQAAGRGLSGACGVEPPEVAACSSLSVLGATPSFRPWVAGVQRRLRWAVGTQEGQALMDAWGLTGGGGGGGGDADELGEALQEVVDAYAHSDDEGGDDEEGWAGPGGAGGEEGGGA